MLSKAFEKLLLVRLQVRLNALRFILYFQFGFRMQLSTTQRIMRVVDKASLSLNGRQQCFVVFLDAAKAYVQCYVHIIEQHLQM